MPTAWFNSTPVVVLGVVVAAIAIFLLRGIYYAFFSPLAKIPGPKLYCFTDAPYFYHLFTGRWREVIKELHDQYGPVVRFGAHDVSFINPDAWKQIYGHKNNAEKNFHKDLRVYRLSPSGVPSIITANDDDHKRQRRLLAHAFSEKALREQEDIMKQYIDLLIARLSEKARSNAPVDIVQWYNFTTFDMIGELAFGQSFDCLEQGGYNPWVSMLFQTLRTSPYSQILKRQPLLKPFAKFLIPTKAVQSAYAHQELSEKTIRRRLDSANVERADFMSYVLRHNDEKGMTMPELIEASSTLVIAGSETTATILSGTTYYLMKHRNVYDRLVEEVRTTFKTEEEITSLVVNKLEYLNAVFAECFRMYPPISIGLPRMTPKGGNTIGGFWIPEGTSVSVPQWAAYQSSLNFTEPTRFAPERWLGDPHFATDNRDVVNPFSIGPRNCIGKNLAHVEMRLVLARCLWNFDMEIMQDSLDWDRQRVFLIWDKGSLNVKLTPVQRKQVSGTA